MLTNNCSIIYIMENETVLNISTVSEIAQKYGTPVLDLVEYNK